MDCSPPGPLSMEVLRVRILELVAIPSSRGSSQPRNWTHVSCIAGKFFTICGDRQRGLACCSSWGHKESDMTEQLNWTKLNLSICFPVQHLLSKCSVLELCSSVFLRGSVPIQETILGGNKKYLDWLLFMSSLNLNNVLPHVPSSSSFFLFNRY